MHAFFSYLKMYFKVWIQYRWSYLVSVLVDPIVLLINISLFTSVYAFSKTQNILGYSLPQMIWYAAGTTFIWYFIYNYADKNISQGILTGNMSVLLLKPVTVFKVELAEAVSLRMFGVVLEFFPSLILYSVICFPDFMTPWSLLRFLCVMVFAFLINFLLNFLIGMTAFIIKSNFSLQSVKVVIISMLAGAYLPIDFFPHAIKNILGYLPFQCLFYIPLQVFLNKPQTYTVSGYAKIVLLQAFWVLVLYTLYRVLWSRAVKKFCAVGG